MQFVGCSGLPLPNYQLRIRSSSGGTILETFTTDSTGHATVASTGSKWVESTDGRFSGLTLFLSTVSANSLSGGVNTSTYFCLNCCAVPWKKILNFTSGYFGSTTADQSAFSPFQGWAVSPACHQAGCPATVLVAAGLGGGGVGVSCNGSADWNVASGCAADMSLSGVSCMNITYLQSSLSCPPVGTWSGTAQIAAGAGGSCANQILCNASTIWNDTLSVSE